MTIADVLIRPGSPRLTNQQVADLMLTADQDRRRFTREGRFVEAREMAIELDKLQALLT